MELPIVMCVAGRSKPYKNEETVEVFGQEVREMTTHRAKDLGMDAGNSSRATKA